MHGQSSVSDILSNHLNDIEVAIMSFGFRQHPSIKFIEVEASVEYIL